MKKVYILCLIAILPLMASADKVEIDGIYYNLITKGNVAEVKSNPNFYTGSVIIPTSVNYDGIEYSVTSIGSDAFYNCKGLTSIAIPNSITSIGTDAFRNCDNLTFVHISDIETWCKISFEEWANPLYYAHRLFLNGEEVKDLVIPNSINTIGRYAFWGCSGLTSVTIPKNVTSIGYYAFRGCSGLTAVYISDLEAWCNIDFANYSNPLSDAHHLILNGQEVKNLVVPSSVTNIRGHSFYGCSGLTSVVIPNSVTNIGDMAFSGCSGLTSVVIPNSIISIGGNAFSVCSSLTSVTIPNSVTNIGGGAFGNCSHLTFVKIGNSVTNIGSYAFSNCGLTSVIIGSGVKSIGSSAFASCKELTDVYSLAEAVPSTASDAFNNSYIEYAMLHVPEASVDAYSSKKPWKNFKSIVKIMPMYTLTYMVDDDIYKLYQVEEGSTINIEANPVKEGCTFSGWSEIPETMPAYDVTVTGSFTANTYTLTYIVDGEVFKTSEFDCGTIITPETAPTKMGYSFSGWSEMPETMPAYDVTVTGSFIVNKYQVTYIINDEVFTTDHVEYGTTIVPPAIEEQEEFTFSGWNDLPETMPAHDIVVHASFTSGFEEIIANHKMIRIYGPDGKPRKWVQKGLNIIISDNGSTKKVFVK